LKALMNKGKEPSKEFLDGHLFRGLNVGFLPRLIGRRKFIKSFYKKRGLFLIGSNLRVKQNDPDEEYIKLLKGGGPRPEGYFLVESAKDNTKWNHYQDAAFLSYGRGNNAWYQPAKLLRDYLVNPFPENGNILLGHAYFAIGPFQVSFGFFVLEKV